MDQQREKSLTMDDLYGEGKAYPEPYNAGAWPRFHFRLASPRCAS